MAIAALKQILDWQVARIATTLQAIADPIEQWAREHDLKPLGADDGGPHMLEVGIPAHAMARIAQRLAENNFFVGVRGASGLRISPHLYTTDQDVRRLFEALTLALNG